MMLGCGDSRFKAWISLKLLTFSNYGFNSIYLIDILEVSLHAFNGNILACLDRLGF